MNAALSAQAALLSTLQEIQDRAEVEDCIRDMLVDVEISVHLEQRLKATRHTQLLQRRLEEHEEIAAESRALRMNSAQKQSVMADSLLQELLSLSEELGELKEVKKQHENLLMQYDELVAKSMQAEENQREERKVEQGRQRLISERGQVEEIAPENTEIVASPPSSGEKAPTIAADVKEEASLAAGRANDARQLPTTDETNQEKIVSLDEPPSIFRHSEETNKEAPDLHAAESTDDAAVVALDDEGEPDSPRFDEFDMEILMKVFAYLDALDILNTAQINISMYSRVDALFGFGAGAHSDDYSAPDSSTIATNETASVFAPQQTSAASMTATTTTTPTAPAPVASTNVNQPTVVTLPPAPAKPSITVATKRLPTTAVSNSIDSAMNRGIFGLLQPRRPAGAASPATTPPRNFARKATSPSTPDATGPLPMNAAMANSMAAKLSDAELNAIILMTERLKQKESLAARLAKDNEDLVAKLDGTEGVKQFLIGKVRDMEASVSSSVENEIKVAQQIASDQEVIAFLDGRVQELESNSRVVRSEKQAALDELERIQRQSGQKAIVMGDMLQFERERLAESEREWKATKKLLVKEVKSCRAQIVAVQADRDGYREQNETLRRAVANTPNGGSIHGR